ncbi:MULTISPECIES: hypothetical protein [Acinetobacter]|uniref:Antiholin-like protein LrgA n=3 Tax=Acinetobacter haemolyticus TaxID=29430 RepID=A0A1L6KK11_ACIHA|nr:MULTISPECIES: hypothetical protein [Acinetobacter]APR69380.1 hypothetical protein AHTJS_02565 [Acinetobacter haemolyticus]AZN68131.1 hypothetical protein DX910_07350 [Acinetobacter haemolyticus]EEH67698.1 hypothetical protein HMPREF0023_2791 [Acinetobacter sp. ATCC 27244]EFF81451.1 hypothetical protein HMP0015_3052 [Acinetobacter haemolyticus ATCC 19194]ENW20585.1 hypothetical protein F927_00466 [Acinetobacter haemolyticus CIP 64.3 = MTCC 9819]
MKEIDWTAWFYTILLIVVFREGAVAITTFFQHPELGNLVGLISLLSVLLIWRKFRKISNRLIDTNNRIMKESSFAFLPICAGSLIMLVHLGKEIPVFLFILTLSTLLPLWIYAKMAKRWL